MNDLSLSQPQLASAIRLFSAWAEYQLAFRGDTGLTVAIVSNQQILWQAGFGYANMEAAVPAKPATIYRVASITKLFTATAILQLRDQGQLSLHDPIQQHLPWFNIAEAFPLEPPITILNLLTHTSGLPREPLFNHWLDANFPDWAAIKERLARQETVLPRDQKWKYSNLALALAGAIVAAVSGRPYADYVLEYILTPLEMRDSYIHSIPADHPRLATGYSRRDRTGARTIAPYTDAQGLTAAFNLATTGTDLARFIAFQFAKDEAAEAILSQRSRAEMHRPHWVNPDWRGGWGLGFEIQRRGGQTYLGHGGNVRGFSTGLSFNTEAKIGAIALTNADDGDPFKFMLKALRWFGPAIREARKDAETVEALPAEWEAYYGRYRSPWGDEQIMAYEGKLVSIFPAAADPLATMTILETAGDHHFRREQPKHGYGHHGELIEFKLDDNGRAERFLGPSGEGEGSVRIEKW